MEAVEALDTAAGNPKDDVSYGYSFAAACDHLVEALRQRKGNEPLRTEVVRELMMLSTRAETIRAFDTQTPDELARDWESLRAKLMGQSNSKASDKKAAKNELAEAIEVADAAFEGGDAAEIRHALSKVTRAVHVRENTLSKGRRQHAQALHELVMKVDFMEANANGIDNPSSMKSAWAKLSRKLQKFD